MTDPNEWIVTLQKASPPVLLLIALNILGFALKKVPKFPNDFIPVALLVVGTASYPFIAERGDISPAIPYPQVLSLIFGFCIGGGAVAAYETVSGIKEYLAARKALTPPSQPGAPIPPS